MNARAPVLASLAWLAAAVAWAGNPAGARPDGTVTAFAVAMPHSRFASPQARVFFPKMLAAGVQAPPLDAPIQVVYRRPLETHRPGGIPESRQAYRTVVAFFERHLAPPQEEAHP